MSKASEAARALVAATKLATLATLSDDGSPLATLVAIADDGGGRPLLLLSGLSEHTKNLLQRPQASLLVVSPEHGPSSPMDRPRVSLTGALLWLDGDEAVHAKARFLAQHPDAAQYAGLPDFGAATLEPRTIRFVGGFARAATLPLADYLG
jgi:putative heme iron utilization protein